MNVWVLLGVLGLVSFATRAVVPLVVGDRGLPAAVERWSHHLAPGVIAAMLVAAVHAGFRAGDGLDRTAPHLAAVTVAAIAALRGASTAVVLGTGIAAHLGVGVLVALAT